MQKIVALFFLLLLAGIAHSQCNTSDATSCLCEDGSTECDLLPDITVSWYALESYFSGPNEYSQTGNGINNGRLKFTASTPNIGLGPLTVRGSDYFVCGGDTLFGDPGVCPDGSAPKQLIIQRIYHKDNGIMSYTDKWAGAMTYHPTHGHNHVDDWGVFTLRVEDPAEPNPLNWPIVGDGAKLGFCLMDYGTCSNYNGHCRDTNMHYQQGVTLTNPDFPNYGLGGGAYGCSVIEQGISSGYTDIYSENLDGMWINIPPGTCNGNYWIVAEIDPANNFSESDETNNWTAIPFTLTLQDPPGNPNFQITASASGNICSGSSVTLSAPGGLNYLWNTGDTTQSITVTQTGSYTVSLTNHCGSGTSSPININFLPVPPGTSITGDTTVCSGQSTILTSTGSNVLWYDDNGFQVGSGSTFTTPSLTTDRTYYSAQRTITPGTAAETGLPDTTGAGGGFFNGDQSLIFDVFKPLTIKSVKTYANGAAIRTIQLLDQAGNLVNYKSVMVPDGESTINLDFNVPVGTDYRLKVPANSNLFRSSTGINYPYEIVDTISIHTSSAGNSFYYYFYDWKLDVGETECTGPQTAKTVHVFDCTGIDDVDLNEKLSVYPNPNHGNFTIEMDIPGTSGFTYTIQNVLGETILSKHVNSHTGLYKETVSGNDLPGGIYILTFHIDNRYTIARRFVVD